MATTTTKLLTAEEFMQLPDGSLQELVKGRVITMPLPKGHHGICCPKHSWGTETVSQAKSDWHRHL